MPRSLMPLLLLLLALGPVQAAQPCVDASVQGEAVVLAGVDAAGDAVLVDGRVLRLVGLAPRQDEAEDARFRAGIESWRGRQLSLIPLGAADRWGRLPARLLARDPPEGEAELSLALVAAGAARRMADPTYRDCGGAGPGPSPSAAKALVTAAKPALLAGEAIDGHDLAALKVQAGRFMVLAGRVASVGERAQRTYLNLSRRRGEAASIVISRRLWREMQDAGWTAARLNGRAIRAEGVLSGRDGLLLEITTVSALNVID